MTRESKIFGFLPPRSDRTIAPGTLACTATGGLIVDVEAERYRTRTKTRWSARTGAGAPEVRLVRSLIFSSRPAPVTCERVRRTTDIVTGEERQTTGQEFEKPREFRVTIEGDAALNQAGR